MKKSSLTIDQLVIAVGQIPVLPKLLDIICNTTGMGFAAVTLVTNERWIACSIKDNINFGLQPGGELNVELTLCNEVKDSRRIVVFDSAKNDMVYSKHQCPALYGFESYIAVPIICSDGSFFGTLCAIDKVAVTINTPDFISMFNTFSEIIASQIDLIELLQITETKLKKERETAALREQFVAILGHDLRNPVGAMQNSAEILMQLPLEATVLKFATIIKNSTSRIKTLIDNMLDLAYARSNNGIKLNLQQKVPIESILDQVILELQVLYPNKVIIKVYDILMPVACDANRIGQLFANLLSNAITYGKEGSPVEVKASSASGKFHLSVVNAGLKIPNAIINNLFEPYFRGKDQTGKDGLGLGLYIAFQIAKAHGGVLKVRSTKKETCFTYECKIN